MEYERRQLISWLITSNKIAVESPSLSVITLNVNDLDLSLKRSRLAEWIKKTQDPILSIRDAF